MENNRKQWRSNGRIAEPKLLSYRGLVVIVSWLFILMPMPGCQPAKQFDWKWKWPDLSASGKKTAAASPTSATTPASAEPQPASGNAFSVRILKNRASESDLRVVWSYLDEASPQSADWQMLHRNGLRCGIGQYSDWPAVRAQLEKCGTKIQGEFQVTLSGFSPMNLLSDKLRSERTLFYYDRNGQVHGRDFGPSMMQFSMVTAGQISGGRVRTIFIPRIFKVSGNLDRLLPNDAKSAMTELQLEDFSITVDLGPEEFALIGPSEGKMAESLLGAQLFIGWDQGQPLNYFILISPMSLEPSNKDKIQK
jgi:hypothetical protein